MIVNEGTVNRRIFRGAFCISALMTAAYALTTEVTEAINKAGEGNFAHLGVLLGANVISGVIELYRIHRK